MTNLKDIRLPHPYPKRAFSQYIRGLSDIYSQQNAEDYSVTTLAGVEFTEGHCFYCGKDLVITQANGSQSLDNSVQYDHVMPASSCGLYAKGNIVIACSDCNLEKSNTPVRDYYELRLQRGDNTYFKSLKELDIELLKFQAPYIRDFPEFYSMSLLLQHDEDLVPFSSIEALFKNKIEFPDTLATSSNSDLKMHKSPNYEFWKGLQNKQNPLYANYSDFSRTDYTARVSALFARFIDKFGIDANVFTLGYEKLLEWANDSLSEIAMNSKAEHSKYKTLLTIFFKTFNYKTDELLTYKPALQHYHKK